jgi:rod shape-determining protein MreD
MRWGYFLLAVLAGVMVQTTVAQVLWFQTPVGWVGPEVLAMVAVFVALNVRSATDAALAGWTLGMAMDLTLSGEGMGLLGLLYAAVAAGMFHFRRAFFREKVLTQMLLSLGFCLMVYEAWTLYDLLLRAAPAAEYGRRGVQVLGLSAYTGVLAPMTYAGLRRVQRLLLAGQPAGIRPRRP